jgi:hypothetical protein
MFSPSFSSLLSLSLIIHSLPPTFAIPVYIEQGDEMDGWRRKEGQ